MKMKTAVKLALLSFVLVLPFAVSAKIGVGVGVGKMNIDEQLKPGGIYELPKLPVLNTGDQTSDYMVSIEYHEGQESRDDMGLMPAREWFSFNPQIFNLEPGKVQSVDVTLTVPTKTKPGKYFAYVEAQPVSNSDRTGAASIGIAAASKLWFTVAPANFFEGIYYRAVSLYKRGQPWDTIVLSVIAGVLLLWGISKKLKIQIAVKK